MIDESKYNVIVRIPKRVLDPDGNPRAFVDNLQPKLILNGQEMDCFLPIRIDINMNGEIKVRLNI